MSDGKKKLQVGLVMPIAMIDNCGPEHWLEVKSIIVEALSDNDIYDFDTRIVSESDSSGLIHKRIVQGLYSSDIVICDVSCKNPNVMFELGMRLAFDKPTLIIKDDKTGFSFDTSGIEHVEYPRDLRFSKIVDFKSTLLRKVISTYEDSVEDPEHSPFLKSFGQFKVAKINETEVSPFDLLVEKLDEVQADLNTLKQKNNLQNHVIRTNVSTQDIYDAAEEAIKRFTKNIPIDEIDRNKLHRAVNQYLSRRDLPNLSYQLFLEILESNLSSK